MVEPVLPRDVRRWLPPGGWRQVPPGASASLLYDKLVPLFDTRTFEAPADARRGFLEALAAGPGAEPARPGAEPARLFEGHCRRREWLEQALRSAGYLVRGFEARTTWNLVVGLGNPSVLETGLTLSRFYGFPYVPGSSVKGLARGYALASMGQRLGVEPLGPEAERPTPLDTLAAFLEEGDQARARKWLERLHTHRDLPAGAPVRAMPVAALQQDADVAWFRRAFGTQTRQGEALFLDALPAAYPPLTVDVMNPHYGRYYVGDEDAPADWMDPVPVLFLCVRPGARFAFRVAARSKDLLERLVGDGGWLVDVVQHWGVGGKTRAGYGRMEVLPAGAEPPGGGGAG